MSQNSIATVVVGAGAVGSYFGAMLAKAGKPVTLIGREAHVEAIRREGLRLIMATGEESIRIAASTRLDAVREADVVLFCVKSTDSQATARSIAPLLKPDALVLSLQNGVDNCEVIAAELPQHVVAVAVYVAVAMPAPGVVQHFGRGELLIGSFRAAERDNPQAQSRLHELVPHFADAGVKVEVSGKVMHELWTKLVANCAYNAISGLAQLPYGVMASVSEIRAMQKLVVAEVVAVARAEGYDLTLADGMALVERIAATMPGQKSSTAQDLARGKRTEIDHLNGFIAQRAARHGIAAPVNQTLHALVRLLEVGRPQPSER